MNKAVLDSQRAGWGWPEAAAAHKDSRSSQIVMLTGQVSTRSATEQMPKVLSSYSDPMS